MTHLLLSSAHSCTHICPDIYTYTSALRRKGQTWSQINPLTVTGTSFKSTRENFWKVHRVDGHDSTLKMVAVCMKQWSFLHDFRWIHWQQNLFIKRIICTCNVCIVCSWPACYHSITKSRVKDRNLKLTLIHSSDSDSLNSMKLAGKLWTVNNEQRSVTSNCFVKSALPAALPLNFDLTNYWTPKIRATGQFNPLLHTFADLVNRVGARHNADRLVSTMIVCPTEELWWGGRENVKSLVTLAIIFLKYRGSRDHDPFGHPGPSTAVLAEKKMFYKTAWGVEIYFKQ